MVRVLVIKSLCVCVYTNACTCIRHCSEHFLLSGWSLNKIKWPFCAQLPDTCHPDVGARGCGVGGVWGEHKVRGHPLGWQRGVAWKHIKYKQILGKHTEKASV